MSPRWLKLKAACEYASMNDKRLVELAKAGVVRGYKDPDTKRGDWIFDRLSLDDYRESPLKGQITPKMKAKMIMEGIRV